MQRSGAFHYFCRIHYNCLSDFSSNNLCEVILTFFSADACQPENGLTAHHSIVLWSAGQFDWF